MLKRVGSAAGMGNEYNFLYTDFWGGTYIVIYEKKMLTSVLKTLIKELKVERFLLWCVKCASLWFLMWSTIIFILIKTFSF